MDVPFILYICLHFLSKKCYLRESDLTEHLLKKQALRMHRMGKFQIHKYQIKPDACFQ